MRHVAFATNFVNGCTYNTKKNKIKLLNRKIEGENEVKENLIKNEIKGKTKYWHEC